LPSHEPTCCGTRRLRSRRTGERLQGPTAG
jgi:hypothetical protein